jgi:NADP-dependent 3-hydroxy acid dehydrogenase YdfG
MPHRMFDIPVYGFKLIAGNWVKMHPKESMNIQQPLTTADIVEMVKFIMAQPDHINIPRLMILPKGHNI